ncbi:MAG: metallophosphoesterase [Deltaproteobacteria bacterium]|nr:metallophosphoesterase [Deltaproteobacteria bacterium]
MSVRERGRPRLTTLAHITDAHVAPRGRRNAVLKDRSVEILSDLVDQVAEANADATLFGGDNIDNRGDGSRDLEEFLRLANKGPDWLCVVGNHEASDGQKFLSKDEFARRAVGHGIRPGQHRFSEVVGDVRIIGIDTTLVGSHGGHVDDSTLAFLARELRSALEPHVVVLGHHLLAAPWAPYRLDAWDQEYLVSNRDVVTGLLASFPRVRAYLCGHHHASRIHRIAGRGEGGGFWHIMTSSPVAYPHSGRLLRFESDRLVVRSMRPRLDRVAEDGLAAVMSGRKARRYSALGSARSFLDYVAGQPSDNDVILPLVAQPREPSFPWRRPEPSEERFTVQS